MHVSPQIHIFLNIEGVVCPRGSAAAVFDAVTPEALSQVWCWSKPLEDIADAIDFRLVLRSSWTMQVSIERIAQCMSEKLRSRLAGVADPIAEIGLSGPRRIATPYQVINRYCAQHGVKYWCALDDREKGWSDDESWRLIRTDPNVGLSDEETILALRTAVSFLAFERAGAFRPATSVEERPCITLSPWRVYEALGGEHYFVGHCAETRAGRVSSAIVSYDAQTRTGVTRSGRRYVLSGHPGFDVTAEYLWTLWSFRNGIRMSRDVSDSYLGSVDGLVLPGQACPPDSH